VYGAGVQWATNVPRLYGTSSDETYRLECIGEETETPLEAPAKSGVPFQYHWLLKGYIKADENERCTLVAAMLKWKLDATIVATHVTSQ
jgi:hypothetical protein